MDRQEVESMESARGINGIDSPGEVFQYIPPYGVTCYPIPQPASEPVGEETIGNDSCRKCKEVPFPVDSYLFAWAGSFTGFCLGWVFRELVDLYGR